MTLDLKSVGLISSCAGAQRVVGDAISSCTDILVCIVIIVIVSGYLGQINLEVYLSFNQKNTQVYQCYSVLASTFKKEVFLVQPFKFRLTLSRLSLTFWIEKVKGLQDSSVHIYIYIYIYI